MGPAVADNKEIERALIVEQANRLNWGNEQLFIDSLIRNVPFEALKKSKLTAPEKGERLFLLARALELGVTTPRDHVQSYAFYRLAALAGNTNAQMRLSKLFGYDNPVGLAYLKEAAERGNTKAQNSLSKFLLDQGNSPKNNLAKSKAYNWLLGAAKADDVSAQYKLGHYLLIGENFAKDQAEGIKWLDRAARNGHRQAQYDLSQVYLIGQGVEKNIMLGEKHLTDAAYNSHAMAQFQLGQLLSNDKIEEKISWYLDATRKKHPEAPLALARLYVEGNGVKKSNVIAFMWAVLAAERGSQDAKKMVVKYSKKYNEKQKSRILYELSYLKADNFNDALSLDFEQFGIE